MTTKPLSIRQYAEHRRRLGLPGKSHSAVRRAARDGRLAGVLTSDGKIADAAEADRLWARRTSPAHSERYRGQPAPPPVRMQGDQLVVVEGDKAYYLDPVGLLGDFQALEAAALALARAALPDTGDRDAAIRDLLDRVGGASERTIELVDGLLSEAAGMERRK